jgi:hypothetical protein
MTSFDKDIQLENLALTYVVSELTFWNEYRLIGNVLERKVMDSMKITYDSVLKIPLLTDRCTVNEFYLLNPISMDIDYKSWERCINWDLFNKIVLVNAYRLALIGHTIEFMVRKKLPGGWNIDREDYNIFMQSMNRNPKLSEKMFMTQIIAKAGISSIPSLASDVANLNGNIYLKDIEECAIQMKKI